MGWKISRPALILKVSASNIGGYYVSYLFVGLTVPVLKPFEAFYC